MNFVNNFRTAFTLDQSIAKFSVNAANNEMVDNAEEKFKFYVSSRKWKSTIEFREKPFSVST